QEGQEGQVVVLLEEEEGRREGGDASTRCPRFYGSALPALFWPVSAFFRQFLPPALALQALRWVGGSHAPAPPPASNRPRKTPQDLARGHCQRSVPPSGVRRRPRQRCHPFW